MRATVFSLLLLVGVNCVRLPVVSRAGSVSMIMDFLRPKADVPDAAGTPSMSGLGDRLVSQHMTTSLVSLHPDDSLKEAAQTLVNKGITGAPVVEDGILVGVLSRTDLLHKIAGVKSLDVTSRGARSQRYMDNTVRLQKMKADTVRSAMSATLASVRPSTTMQEAAATMLGRKLNRLLVSDEEGHLVGIVSASDVVELTLCDEADCSTAA